MTVTEATRLANPQHPCRTVTAAPLLRVVDAKWPTHTEREKALRIGVHERTLQGWRAGGRVRPDTARHLAVELGSTFGEVWFS